MKFWIVLCSIFFITMKLVTSERSHLVNSALKKACDIITNTLFEASNTEEKAEVLRSVEEKWNIFSPTVEINENFKNLVIHAIKCMVSLDDYRLCTNISESTKDALLKMFNLTGPSPSKSFVSKTSINDVKKSFLLRETVQKIDALVSKVLKKSKSDYDKQKTIDFIKKRIEKSFKLKERLRKSTNETNLYTGIIFQGIDMMVNKSFQRPVQTKYIGLEEAASTEIMKRRNEAALGGIENLVYIPSQPKVVPSLLSKSKPTLELDIDNTIGKDVVDNNLAEIITPGPLIGLTKDYDCHDTVAQVCLKLKDVSEFKCESDGEVLGIEQFCDGSVDCSDGSDEINCAKHAVNRIHFATRIISEIDLAKNCFENAIGSSMLPYQGNVLSQLLKKQVAFIEKYTNNPKRRAFLKTSNYNDIFEVVTEVVAIVKSFSLSLNSALCMNADNEVDKIISEGESLLDAEPTLKKSVHDTLGECDCNNHVCLHPTCPAVCKRICYQTYTLSRWACKPVKEGAVGVALDDLCDGKNDCYDETDESNCASDNFESNHIFEEILKATKTYAMSKNFEAVRSRLISLHSAVHQLQKHSKGLNNNNAIFRMERDNIFSMLTDIYLDLVEEYDNMDRAEEAFLLLISLNEKLVRALKRSYTGNEKTQSFAEDCTCQDKKCTQSNCTRECVRLCFVRDILTTYPCSNSSGTHSVHVDIMCNGKPQCPKGEDEENCRNEICRKHHLVVLRHNLQIELDKYSYTALEGVLESWKEKATERINNAEKLDRLSPLVYKMLLQDILRDLAETYASQESLEESKMVSNERILKKYQVLSINIMELAKACIK